MNKFVLLAVLAVIFLVLTDSTDAWGRRRRRRRRRRLGETILGGLFKGRRRRDIDDRAMITGKVNGCIKVEDADSLDEIVASLKNSETFDTVLGVRHHKLSRTGHSYITNFSILDQYKIPESLEGPTSPIILTVEGSLKECKKGKYLPNGLYVLAGRTNDKGELQISQTLYDIDEDENIDQEDDERIFKKIDEDDIA